MDVDTPAVDPPMSVRLDRLGLGGGAAAPVDPVPATMVVGAGGASLPDAGPEDDAVDFPLGLSHASDELAPDVLAVRPDAVTGTTRLGAGPDVSDSPPSDTHRSASVLAQWVAP